MSALSKVSTLTCLIAEIGECDELHFALDGAIKIFTDMKTALVPVRQNGLIPPPPPVSISEEEEDIPIAQLIRNKTAEKSSEKPAEKVVKKRVKKTLVFKPAENKGKCGLTADGKQLQIPICRGGCLGDERGVITTEYLPVPKVINKEWLGQVAGIIKRFPVFDWDWGSFRRNIISPNIDAIATEMRLNEFFKDRLERNGYVVLNNWDGQEEAEKEAIEAGFTPVSHRTFFTYEDCEF